MDTIINSDARKINDSGSTYFRKRKDGRAGINEIKKIYPVMNFNQYKSHMYTGEGILCNICGNIYTHEIHI